MDFIWTPFIFQENNVKSKVCIWENNPEPAKQADFVLSSGGINLWNIIALHIGDLFYDYFSTVKPIYNIVENAKNIFLYKIYAVLA